MEQEFIRKLVKTQIKPEKKFRKLLDYVNNILAPQILICLFVNHMSFICLFKVWDHFLRSKSVNLICRASNTKTDPFLVCGCREMLPGNGARDHGISDPEVHSGTREGRHDGHHQETQLQTIVCTGAYHEHRPQITGNFLEEIFARVLRGLGKR